MKYTGFALFFILIFAPTVEAKPGYVALGGQTIRLVKAEQVQLVSEDVVITPMCGWATDLIDYRCTFILKSLAPKVVKVQVGFPLNGYSYPQPNERPKATDLVLDYHFIARDEKNTYDVRAIPRDDVFGSLVWDMEFNPKETKVLHVLYQLPISSTIGSTRKRDASSKDQFWHVPLEMSFNKYFTYYTKGGKSWAGPIEKATFRVETASLANCLGHRSVVFQCDFPESQRNEPESQHPLTMREAGLVYQRISPEDGKYDPETGTTTWEYRDFKPGTRFDVVYYIVMMPRTASDCDVWVRDVLGNKPTKANLAEMRDIAAAFYGIAPRSESAKKFVEQQVWYHPKKDMQEAKLDAEQKAVLARLDAMVKGE
jgi:hypothetical protein